MSFVAQTVFTAVCGFSWGIRRKPQTSQKAGGLRYSVLRAYEQQQSQD
jgi:hypothetical protein